jgi:hypothetical protein
MPDGQRACVCGIHRLTRHASAKSTIYASCANLAQLVLLQHLRLLFTVAGDKRNGIAAIQKLDCGGYLLWAHLQAGGESLRQVAKWYGVSHEAVRQIIRKHNKAT